jgi:hypothetical protein
MSLAIFSSAAFSTASGLAIAPGAVITVYREDTGTIASIFSDESGAIPLGNPLTADASGRFSFYATGLLRGYRITVTFGAESYDLRNIPIGTAAQVDITAFGTDLIDSADAASAHQVFDRDVVNRAANTALHLSDWGRTINFTAGFTQTIDTYSTLADGWWVNLRNSSGADVVVDPNAAEKIDDDVYMRLKPGQSCRLVCTGQTPNSFKTIGLRPPVIQGYLTGFGTANGTDAVNDIDFSAGLCADSTAITYLTGGALTKQLDAAWAAGTNAGMRDTGVIADNTWHLFAIKSDTDGSVDYLASLSATAPTMPAGYTLFRRIASIIRSGATILAYSQKGDEFLLSAPVSDYAANNPGTAAVTRALTVPNLIKVSALHTFAVYTDDVTAASPYGYLSAIDQANTAASVTAFTVRAGGGGSAGDDAFDSTLAWIRTSTAKNVRTRISASTVNVTVYGITHGWEDRRGRDD